MSSRNSNPYVTFDPMEQDRFIRVSKAAEKFWLVAIAVSAGLAAYAIATEGWESQGEMVLIPVLAGLWYGFRRTFRKRMERKQS
jgi:membrane protein implicated in regulation of membrane protease activity